MIDEKKLIERLQRCVDTSDNSNFTNGLLSAIDIVNQQPKIGGWIPCSEKYPEWGTKSYLVCLKNGGIFMAICSYVGEFKEISSLGIRDFSEDNPVIAWKPLPEPYEVEENG